MNNTRIFLERVNFGRYVNVHMAVEHDMERRSVAEPVVFREVTDGAVESAPPMLQIRPEQAQNLMDELWTVGFRPTQGQQSEGQMGATTNHLNDMRALVSALAKVQLP